MTCHHSEVWRGGGRERERERGCKPRGGKEGSAGEGVGGGRRERDWETKDEGRNVLNLTNLD